MGESYTTPTLMDVVINDRFLLKLIHGGLRRFPQVKAELGLLQPSTPVEALVYLARRIASTSEFQHQEAATVSTDFMARRRQKNSHSQARAASPTPARSASPLHPPLSPMSATPARALGSPLEGQAPRRGERTRTTQHSNLNETGLAKGVAAVDENHYELEDSHDDRDIEAIENVQCWYCSEFGHYRNDCEPYDQYLKKCAKEGVEPDRRAPARATTESKGGGRGAGGRGHPGSSPAGGRGGYVGRANGSYPPKRSD